VLVEDWSVNDAMLVISIFIGYISGTILCPATDSFVHWRDYSTNSEWGLNFTTPADSKRFRDCCSV